MTTTPPTLLQFPCDFPIKIIGVNSAQFSDDIRAIVLRHFPALTDKAITSQPSKNSNFLAITVHVYAENQHMLDDFYQEVSKHPLVKMAL